MMRDKIKQHYGEFLLLMAYIVFVLLFFGAYMQNMAEKGQTISWIQPNIGLLIVVFVLGSNIAIIEFKYLHVRQMVDCYHALPIKRSTVFWKKIRDSLVMFSMAQTILVLLEVLIAGAVDDVNAGMLLQAGFASWILYILAFAGTFFIVALAMIMTGHTGIGIFIAVIFMAWSSMFYSIIYSLSDIFFQSFGDGSFPLLRTICFHGSPIAAAIQAALIEGNAEFWRWNEHIGSMVSLGIWIFVLCALSWKLFEIRPSEAAGSATAFPKINSILRICIVVPLAVFTGMGFYLVFAERINVWVLFAGAVIGVIFFHALMEGIMALDIRKAFSHKSSLILSILITLVLIMSFDVDLYGYDRYQPTTENVEAINIAGDVFASFGSSDIIYYKELPDMTGELKDDVVQTILDNVDRSSDDGVDRYKVSFRLKNGQIKIRSYVITEETCHKLIANVADYEYKKELYSLYQMDWEKIDTISWQGIRYDADLNWNEKEKKEFLTIYSNELESLNSDMVKNVRPVGAFMLEYESSVEEDGTEYDLYYLYPSFTDSIAYLKERGYDSIENLDEVNIQSIELSKLDEESGDELIKIIDDTELISGLKEHLYVSWLVPDYYDRDNREEAILYDITAYDEENREITIATDDETLRKLLSSK